MRATLSVARWRKWAENGVVILPSYMRFGLVVAGDVMGTGDGGWQTMDVLTLPPDDRFALI